MPVELYNPQTGRFSGDVGARLATIGDINALRTYRWDEEHGGDGRTYMDRFVGNDDDGNPQYDSVVVNEDSPMNRESWRLFDNAVVEAARAETRLWGDMNDAGLGETIDAMSITTVTYQKRLGQAHARVSMNPAVASDRDRALSSLANTPIPFIFSDWQYPVRDMRIAERGGQQLDLESVRECTRAVLETVDDLILGDNATPFDYNGLEMPGLLNFGDAIPYTLTLPTAPGWGPDTLYDEINEMMQLLIDQNYFGPWMMYVGSAWSLYLNMKYSAQFQSRTLRQEILDMDGISGIRTIRRFTNDFRIVLLQMTKNVFRVYNGMPLRAIRWQSLDGWNVYGKVITSVAPQPRSDALGQTGILVAAGA